MLSLQLARRRSPATEVVSIGRHPLWRGRFSLGAPAQGPSHGGAFSAASRRLCLHAARRSASSTLLISLPHTLLWCFPCLWFPGSRLASHTAPDHRPASVPCVLPSSRRHVAFCLPPTLGVRIPAILALSTFRDLDPFVLRPVSAIPSRLDLFSSRCCALLRPSPSPRPPAALCNLPSAEPPAASSEPPSRARAPSSEARPSTPRLVAPHPAARAPLAASLVLPVLCPFHPPSASSLPSGCPPMRGSCGRHGAAAVAPAPVVPLLPDYPCHCSFLLSANGPDAVFLFDLFFSLSPTPNLLLVSLSYSASRFRNGASILTSASASADRRRVSGLSLSLSLSASPSLSFRDRRAHACGHASGSCSRRLHASSTRVPDPTLLPSWILGAWGSGSRSL